MSELKFIIENLPALCEELDAARLTLIQLQAQLQAMTDQVEQLKQERDALKKNRDTYGPKVVRKIRELQTRNGELEKALEAFAEAFAEPAWGSYLKLRAFAESHGIYADDLGRDRILLRIARAALAHEPGQEEPGKSGRST